MASKKKRLIITILSTLIISGIIIGGLALKARALVYEKVDRTKQIGKLKQLSLSIQMYLEKNKKLPVHSDLLSTMEFSEILKGEKLVFYYDPQIEINTEANFKLLSHDGIVVYSNGSVADTK